MANSFLPNVLGRLFPKKPKPEPAPAPTPAPAPEPPVDDKPSPSYLRALWILRQIPVNKLFPALITAPVIAFLAISGIIAWVIVLFSFAIRLLRVFTGI
jgi:hypothetical protein